MRAWLDTGCHLLERRLLPVHNRRFVRSYIQCATNIRHQLAQRRHSPSLRSTPLTNCRDASSTPRSKHRTNKPRTISNNPQRADGDHASAGGRSKPTSGSDGGAPTNNTKEKIRKSADFPRAEEVGEQEFRRLVSKPQTMLETTLQELGRVSRSATGGRRQYHATVSMTWRDTNKKPIHAVGDGANAEQASLAAWYHLIVLLHKAGDLVPLLAQAPLPMDADLAKREQNALIEVYEYCVRHGDLPVIDRKPRRSRTRLTWQTTITFPVQNINVTVASKNSLDADLLAAVKFKTAAEAYQKEQGTTSLVVRAQDSLNVENSEPFLKFYTYASGKKSQLLSMESKPIDKQRFEFYGEMDGALIGAPVIAGTKKVGEKLAYLVAAHTLLSREPQLKSKFFVALKKGNGNILLPMKPLDLPVGAHVALRMQNTLLEARQNGLADEYEPLLAEISSNNESAFPRPQMTETELQARNEHLQSMRQTYQTSDKTEAMRKLRADLPMTAYAESVLDIIDNNTYSIIIGETGSGKTTQVPQILMDHYVDAGNGTACNIICTQPRRIAATSVARRVADERGEGLRASVGYMVRGDNQACTKSGNINYVTTGTLLAQLQSDPDDILSRVSHIILDEVHERDRFIDYTMIILKEVLSHRLAEGKSVPRVTLMSATLDPELFAPYFSNRRADGSESPTPVLRVPGRTFPVKEMYLEDVYEQLSSQLDGKLRRYVNEEKTSREYIQLEQEFVQENGDGSSGFGKGKELSRRVIDWKRTSSADGARKSQEDLDKDESLVPLQLVAATIAHVALTTTEGAILVFLPGLDEIQTVEKLLKTQTMFEYNDDKFATFLLHSSIAGNAQAHVFEPCPPGKRKIILSTNIAETSVTIPDVQHVIDTGKHREVHYNQLRRLTALRCTWISKSNAKQRAGRGGRVQNGNYYALYSKCRRDKMRAVGLPELLRTDLQETCLEIFAQKWRIDPRDFLAKAIEPPDPVAIEASINNLLAIEALTSDEQITPLGRLLFTLPIHPELGKMLVYGIILRCLYPMIVLGAAAQNRSLFVSPMGGERERLDKVKFYFGEGQESDHLVILNAFKRVRQIQKAEGSFAAQRFARANYIHWGAYKSIESTAALIEGALVSSGIIPDERSGRAAAGSASLNENADKSYLIKALTVAGLYPKVAVKASPGTYHWRTETEAAVALHPTSLNDNRQSRAEGAVFATFDQLARTADGSGLNARTNTLVSPLAIALFGGRLSSRDDEGNADEDSMWNRARSTSTGRIVVVDEWLPFFVISQNRNAPHILIELRKALQRMLVQAYADLSKRKPLADDRVRAGFAKHLVEILRLDPHAVRLSDRQAPAKLTDRFLNNSSESEDQSASGPAQNPADSFGGSFVNTRVRSGPPSSPPSGGFAGERSLFTPPRSNGNHSGSRHLRLRHDGNPSTRVPQQPRR